MKLENNFHITGEEARLILRLIFSQNSTFQGNELLAVYSLMQRFMEISQVQPPKES